MPEPDPPTAERIREDLFRIPDTCNVYVLRSGREGIAIDFGSGAVLGHLEALGIDRLTDVLVTHHHRDQVQGLDLALAHGANVWIPPVEQDLFRYAEDHWQSRGLDNDYSVRQDKWSPLWPIQVTGVLPEYRTVRFGAFEIEVLPTPGHTIGSVSFLTQVGGDRVAFTGDRSQRRARSGLWPRPNGHTTVSRASAPRGGRRSTSETGPGGHPPLARRGHRRARAGDQPARCPADAAAPRPHTGLGEPRDLAQPAVHRAQSAPSPEPDLKREVLRAPLGFRGRQR